MEIFIRAPHKRPDMRVFLYSVSFGWFGALLPMGTVYSNATATGGYSILHFLEVHDVCA